MSRKPGKSVGMLRGIGQLRELHVGGHFCGEFHGGIQLSDGVLYPNLGSDRALHAKSDLESSSPEAFRDFTLSSPKRKRNEDANCRKKAITLEKR